MQTESSKYENQDRARNNGLKLDKSRFCKDTEKSWIGNGVADTLDTLQSRFEGHRTEETEYNL